MNVEILDAAWGQVDAQECDGIRIKVDNSVFVIKAVDEGIQIRELTSRQMLIVPMASNQLEIITT